MVLNPTSKERLRSELNGLLAVAQGDVKASAEKIANALDKLIEKETQQNKELFVAAVKEILAVPKTAHFKSANAEVKRVLLEMVGRLQTYVDMNEQLKQEMRRQKDRIDAKTQQRPSPK